MNEKSVFAFGSKMAEGSIEKKELLGCKGVNFAQMCQLGIPVPPGLIISTQVCNRYLESGNIIPQECKQEVLDTLGKVETEMNLRFADTKTPLLLSIRSGAPVPMPGMMDSVLNVGLGKNNLEGLIEYTECPGFVYDSYRRLIQMYGTVVLGVETPLFSSVIQQRLKNQSHKGEHEFTAEDWFYCAEIFKQIILEQTGTIFPEDPWEQLWNTIGAVFSSWNSPRAKTYRLIQKIPHHLGTAVNIQAMIYGKQKSESATGILFTRHPATGEKGIHGDCLFNAQGEDVVTGAHRPLPIRGKESLSTRLPEAFAELKKFQFQLEYLFKDMQTVEFAVQNSKVWLIQTRDAKRTAKAAIKIAVDMVEEGLISKEEALLRIDPNSLEKLLHPTLKQQDEQVAIAKGTPASPGGASGKIALNKEQALLLKNQKENYIFIRPMVNPEDIEAIQSASGVLTFRGGVSTHAAVIARSLGVPAIVGCKDLHIEIQNNHIFIGNEYFKFGDTITIDGCSGEVYSGALEMDIPNTFPEFDTLMQWADERRELNIRVNADSPEECRIGLSHGAEGIGLIRSEHIFYQMENQLFVTSLIFSDNQELDYLKQKLFILQKKYFKEVFKVPKNQPIVIRLVDFALLDFLPEEHEVPVIAKKLALDESVIIKKTQYYKESMPRLGYRGCRIGITFPWLYEVQVKAIMEAAYETNKEFDCSLQIELLIPMVSHLKELIVIKNFIFNVIHQFNQTFETNITPKIGASIELPRAAVISDELATEVDFFSFGTNDLTQNVFGFSREDAMHFYKDYEHKGILLENPFVQLDRKGVGHLIEISRQKGRLVNKNLKLGVCGEQGGDPQSIHFFHAQGLDYISCSAYRIPIARLAAAQAALTSSRKTMCIQNTALVKNEFSSSKTLLVE